MLYPEQDICAKIRELEAKLKVTPPHESADILWDIRNLRSKLGHVLDKQEEWRTEDIGDSEIIEEDDK